GLIQVGERRTLKPSALRAELQGNCDGATHFVRGAMVGAYAVDQGKKGQMRGALDVFGAAAGGAAGSSSTTRFHNGEVSNCQGAQVNDQTPPNQCGALVRLELA